MRNYETHRTDTHCIGVHNKVTGETRYYASCTSAQYCANRWILKHGVLNVLAVINDWEVSPVYIDRAWYDPEFLGEKHQSAIFEQVMRAAYQS